LKHFRHLQSARVLSHRLITAADVVEAVRSRTFFSKFKSHVTH